MPLDTFQRSVLKTARNLARERGVSLYLLTGSGLKANDAYSIQEFTRQSLRTFSGAVAWIPTEQRRDTEGGFTQVGEVLIAIDRVEKTQVERRDTILEVDGIELRITRIVDLPETDELLINAERI